jgi:hypothetical protein
MTFFAQYTTKQSLLISTLVNSYLNGVREEAEGFIAHQTVDRDLLDPEDDGAVRQVFLDDGSGTGV